MGLLKASKMSFAKLGKWVRWQEVEIGHGERSCLRGGRCSTSSLGRIRASILYIEKMNVKGRSFPGHHIECKTKRITLQRGKSGRVSSPPRRKCTRGAYRITSVDILNFTMRSKLSSN